jgi:hypothetical protein
LTFTDFETLATSFYGYQTYPGPPGPAVGYYVAAFTADGLNESPLETYATYLPQGTPICF